mmetsp:Transcript_13075/g.33525  ORF Transcript_13075/g.33525 Transcript_13075/m.33525 type:complete len:202 (+) Transcript_13075:109-714(+)|eukprot:CAMPEP_0115876830 /NCGR_PEP_ID=MMETSP0287-20121206/25890_1 /TAXON_ID=412157 /ORGANISM="Chrysochromulina rotalis, Strain UIO044" /LENGTH=201 /DNA_ID=CAMNT_0003332287 /DNA_START=108 /DNA_END=713 /DNA_ORIENTATION=+
MAASSTPPSAPQQQSDPNSVLNAWIQRVEQEPMAEINHSVPIAFMVGWGAISTLALGSGALIGFRSFDDSVAYEVLDHKVERPSPAAEAQAHRMAVRALGWGTVCAVGTAAVAVAATYSLLGVRSAADVGDTARALLAPVDGWLKRRGDFLQATADGSRAAFDGIYEGLAGSWRSSWAGGFARRRIEGGEPTRGSEREASS